MLRSGDCMHWKDALCFVLLTEPRVCGLCVVFCAPCTTFRFFVPSGTLFEYEADWCVPFFTWWIRAMVGSKI